MKKSKKILLLACLIPFVFSCKKEYITNEYVTNENIYQNQYYLLNEMEEITEDIRPPYLKKGDTIAIFASSNSVTKDQLKNGIDKLKSWGLAVKEADNLYKADGRYAGTQSERIEGLQKLLDNPNVKAIIAARGGYGATQVGSYLDWTKFEQNPKWLIGFSDITYFHAILNNKGVESIHGAMAYNLTNGNSVESLRKALFGELTSYMVNTNVNCIEGKAEGRLVGGNLSLIYSLGGTLYDLNVRDAILLIEDTGENNYEIDRMMNNLKQSAKLDCVKGVIVGEFTSMNQGNDKSIAEIMKEQLEPLGIPVLYGMNIGHDSENLAVYLGRQVSLEVGEKSATVTFK